MILFPVLLAVIILVCYRQAMAGKVVTTVVRVGDISYYMHPLALSVRSSMLLKHELLLMIYRMLNVAY